MHPFTTLSTCCKVILFQYLTNFFTSGLLWTQYQVNNGPVLMLILLTYKGSCREEQCVMLYEMNHHQSAKSAHVSDLKT